MSDAMDKIIAARRKQAMQQQIGGLKAQPAAPVADDAAHVHQPKQYLMNRVGRILEASKELVEGGWTVDHLREQMSENGRNAYGVMRTAAKEGKDDVFVLKAHVEAFDRDVRNIAEKLQADIEQKRQLDEQAKRAWKDGFTTLLTEHGDVFLPNITKHLIVGGVNRGRHMILLGPPGTGKTDIMRAVAKQTNRAYYHLDPTGMVDPSQLEATQYIRSVNGAPQTESKETAMMEAMRNAAAGNPTILGIDELARMHDMAIANQILLAMSHDEYHAVLAKETLRWQPGMLVVVATANLSEGYNFSGNNRRGVDSALMDRFRPIYLNPVPPQFLPTVIRARVQGVTDEMLNALRTLYEFALKDEQYAPHVSTRTVLDLADAWVTLESGSHFKLSEVVKRVLSWRIGDEDIVKALVVGLEGRKL